MIYLAIGMAVAIVQVTFCNVYESDFGSDFALIIMPIIVIFAWPVLFAVLWVCFVHSWLGPIGPGMT